MAREVSRLDVLQANIEVQAAKVRLERAPAEPRVASCGGRDRASQGNILRARAELSAAHEQLQRVELMLHRRLAAVFQEYDNARATVVCYRSEILPAAEETLQLVSKGYQQGEVGYLELLTVQRTFFKPVWISLRPFAIFRSTGLASRIFCCPMPWTSLRHSPSFLWIWPAGLAGIASARYDRADVSAPESITMADFLKNLLLAASCVPLVFGCCWQDYSTAQNFASASPQLSRGEASADSVAGREHLQASFPDEESKPTDGLHVCLRGTGFGSVIGAQSEVADVQFCSSAAILSCSPAVCNVARPFRNAPLSNSTALYLAKQAILI